MFLFQGFYQGDSISNVSMFKFVLTSFYYSGDLFGTLRLLVHDAQTGAVCSGIGNVAVAGDRKPSVCLDSCSDPALEIPIFLAMSPKAKSALGLQIENRFGQLFPSQPMGEIDMAPVGLNP